jgi:glycosyltransferase involved in cell wall biosynthesis
MAATTMASSVRKHLEIANFPPPYDGWSTHTKFVVDEIRRRGHQCEVLKINENRRVRAAEYVDVQDGWDYVQKVMQFARGGFSINVHCNAESPKGYLLALIALTMARVFRRRGTLTFHGGIPQSRFPKPRNSPWYWAFWLLFHLATDVICDSEEIQSPISTQYGLPSARICSVSGFSAANLMTKTVVLPLELETFITVHHPVFFCYVSFRPEYRLEVLREAMQKFVSTNPHAGFVWLGFSANELKLAEEYVNGWPAPERQHVFVLGTVDHDTFLSLLRRCTAKLRTPACDGVSASVLESLGMGIPVVASENGRRPAGVITYREMDSDDMCAKLLMLIGDYERVRKNTCYRQAEDNVSITADWLVGR